MNAPTASFMTWKDIATFFFDRSAAGFWEFKIKIKLSPKSRLRHDPSDRTLSPKQRNI